MNIDTNFLNGTRFLLALWVAAGHFYLYSGGHNLYKIPLLGSPGIAVDGFMVITGFLMAYQYILRESKEPFDDKYTSIKFIIRRIFRLYPVYFLSIITYVLLFPYIYDNTSEALRYFNNGAEWLKPPGDIQPYSIITHLLFLHGLIPSHVVDILSPTWSLSLEMQFYFLFPSIFVYFFVKHSSNKLIPFIVLTLVVSLIVPKLFGLYLIKGTIAHFEQPSLILYKLPLFLLGMMAASVGLNKLKLSYLFLTVLIIVPFQNKITILLIMLLLLFMFLDSLEKFLNLKIFNALLFVRKSFSGRLSFLGANIAYSIYLFHMIILPFSFNISINKLRFIDGISMNNIVFCSFILFISLTVFCSYLSYKLIEKPFINYGKNVANRFSSKMTIKTISADRIVKK